MTLQYIKETKRYGQADARRHGQRQNSLPLEHSLLWYRVKSGKFGHQVNSDTRL